MDAYVSIVHWPEGATRAAFIVELEPVKGGDRFALRKSITIDGPSVVGPFAPEVACTGRP